MDEGAPPQPGSRFPQIAAEIDGMAEVDQDMRTKPNMEESWDENVDRTNTARMKEIVTGIGWPTVSKVGEESAHNAWLLVQHADHDVVFQEQCLELMKQESAGEVARRDIAYLEDRIRVHIGRPQIYGTQFRQVGGKHVPEPIEDEANVDERRRAMGLGTLEEGIQEMYEAYGTPSQE